LKNKKTNKLQNAVNKNILFKNVIKHLIKKYVIYYSFSILN